ncbi:UbiA family prenyltransferase [Nocardioides marmoriginsengisoli]|uniref:UbiA family prenyltransferase n=1 Tax=Nocardioides marmoriginsengisoli TaxID=661483 RepID=UPI001610BE99|nr:UbiA family prenyltransferase [Nocardioides marmoriginsengisoli]
MRTTHPKQAVCAAAVVGILAAADGRPARELLMAAAAVLVVQLSLGISNDLCDQQHDYRAQTPGKPIAGGQVPAASAGYWMIVLVLLAVPLSAYNGVESAIALLATLPIGWIHNRWLHRTAFSFVGWTLTFALIPAFLSYGTWSGSGSDQAPTWAVTGAAAAVGFCVHFVTTLGDLVADNKSGARTLPLRIALRIGAPRLLLVTIVITAAAVAGLVVAGLTVGLRQ